MTRGQDISFLKSQIQVDSQKYLEAIENTRISLCSAGIFHSAVFDIQPFSNHTSLPSPELASELALLMGSELDCGKMGVHNEPCENPVALNTSCM